jgi:hypothetical protein
MSMRPFTLNFCLMDPWKFHATLWKLVKHDAPVESTLDKYGLGG